MNLNKTDNLMQLADLISNYYNGTLSPSQQVELEAKLMADASFKQLLDSFGDKSDVLADLKMMNGFDTESLLSQFHKKHAPSKTIKLWPRIALAAAAVTAIIFGIWLFVAEMGIPKQVQDDLAVNDIAPGKNKATLSFNGKSMQLNEAKTGVRIDKGKLTYNDGTTVSDVPHSLQGEKSNMVIATTPRGGTYEFVLEEGTRVWLNADSKLEFFSNYKNKRQRIVKLEGEGYFEVAKDKSRPFIVESAGQKVEVLGTHFNINAYAEESLVRTTLLEGSVAVRGSGNSVVLKPNQQSVATDNGSMAVKQVDPSEALAWKSGRFIFNNTPMQVVMRQIARWYDVEVAYQDEDLQHKLLDGSVSRYENISGILSAISQTGAAKFKIDHHKIIVIK